MRYRQRKPLQHQQQNQLNFASRFFFYVIAFDLLLQKGAQRMRKLLKQFREMTSDENFIHIIEHIEVIVAKILSICMLGIIFVAIGDLISYTYKSLTTPEIGGFYKTLFKIFGLFLNVLIALEILENITGYLKKHVLQVELVIVTSLIAVARKIIILDLDKVEGVDIIGLGLAVLSLSISYWIIRSSNNKPKH